MSTLYERLQRLRPAVKLPAAPPPRSTPARRPGLPGQERITPQGCFQLIETVYPNDFRHGALPLGDFLHSDGLTAARLAGVASGAPPAWDAAAFIDIETTGLSGGAGTLAFLVGVGRFTPDGFNLRQYFLSDPAQEEALLTELAADLAPCPAWISFNGRAFDLPILETRFTLNQQRGALGRRPHLDLLPPARRLYRGRLPACALGQLERDVLRVIREQDDVPGELIPALYLDYLRSGETDSMRRVIYHNTLDVLSMVTLAAHLLPLFSTPLSAGEAPVGRDGPALLRLALWHEANGRLTEAEVAYRQALADLARLDDPALCLTRLAGLLKKQNRRAEAIEFWQQLASRHTPGMPISSPAGLTPFIELAKFYEWHQADIAEAIRWTQRALTLVSSGARPALYAEVKSELRHRLDRLQKKLAQ